MSFSPEELARYVPVRTGNAIVTHWFHEFGAHEAETGFNFAALCGRRPGRAGWLRKDPGIESGTCSRCIARLPSEVRKLRYPITGDLQGKKR